MSVKTVRHAGNRGPAQTERAFSAGVWHDCPLLAIQDGELPGVVTEFNFDRLNLLPPATEGNFNDFTAYATAGVLIAAGPGGGATIGGGADNAGAGIRFRAMPFRISRAAKKLWWELILKTSTIADTTHGFVTGLIQDTTLTATNPIVAAGTLADLNFVGFHRLETDGDMIDTVYKADLVPQVTVGADAIAIQADTYFKLGMVYDPGNDSTIHDPLLQGLTRYNLKFLKDGIPLAASKQIPVAAGTDFPNDVNMSFFFSLLNAVSTTGGTTTLDKVRIAQLF